jgi:hypothetical protein
MSALDGMFAPEDIRDLISDAISDSLDMDWQPGWGADAVIKALADAGLLVVPDFAKICAERDYTCASVSVYPTDPAQGWHVNFHQRGTIYGSPTDARVRDQFEATAAALTDSTPFVCADHPIPEELAA